jgi:TolA-binding protein
VFEALDEGNPTRIVSPAEWLSHPLEPARASADSDVPAGPPVATPAPRVMVSPLWSREAAWFKAQSLTRRVSIVLFPLALCSAVVVFLDAPATPAPTPARRAAVAAADSLAQAAPNPAEVSTVTAASATEPVTAPSLPAGVQKTLQRQAADALAEGNYATARTLYQALLASEPNNATYGAAVRLLDQRLAKRR